MKHENHIINKQVFEFSCSRYEDAFQLQKQMESGLQHSIQSGIEAVLSDWNDTAETIRIDKLEIDIGEIAFDRLTNLLPGKIYTGLSGKLNTTLFPCKSSIEVQQKNSNNDKAELLEIFLLSGSLPWWAGAAGSFSLSETIQQLIENDTARVKTLLLKNFLNEKFTGRLVYQTDAALLKKLTDLLPSFAPLRLIIESIITKVVEHANEYIPLPAKNISTIQHDVSVANENLSKNIYQLVFKLFAVSPLSGNVEQFKLFLKEKIAEVFGRAITEDQFKKLFDTAVAAQVYSMVETLEKEIAQFDQAANFSFDENTLAESGEKIYIQNAGLVLIARFFPSLFKELQWTDDGVFKNKEAQVKALFLLHYITTGINAAPEYTLQLNKILCGIKLDEPVPFSVELTAEEKKEADQLLQDVVGHWAALKSSSAEALRGSFFLRDALLSYKNGRWLLQVERKGYDVLLDHIPWSWTTVKFGWMETYIETEW